jgi:hypothetical protein
MAQHAEVLAENRCVYYHSQKPLKSAIPCRNGPSCKYLARKSCVYTHASDQIRTRFDGRSSVEIRVRNSTDAQVVWLSARSQV